MDNKFEYVYSTEEQEEIRKIRKKYQSEGESKLNLLRKLDAEVTKKPTKIALTLGVIGCLVFGTGMSLILLAESSYYIIAILVGILGLAGVIVAYPIYKKVLKNERERVAPEILRLTEELMN